MTNQNKKVLEKYEKMLREIRLTSTATTKYQVANKSAQFIEKALQTERRKTVEEVLDLINQSIESRKLIKKGKTITWKQFISLTQNPSRK